MNIRPILIDYYKKYKVFPPLTFLSKELGEPIKKIESTLDFLVKKGQLQKIKNQYFFILRETEKHEQVQEQKQAKKENFFNIIFVRIVLGVIAGIAMIMSSFYSAVWFNNFLPLFTSWICSCVIVLYASFSIQAAMIIKEKPVKFLLRFTSVIIIIFSIVSTIAGQYRNDNEKKVDQINQIKIAEFEFLKSEEKSILDSIESTKEELDQNIILLSKFSKDEIKSKEYKDIFYKSYTLRNLRNTLDKKLEEKRKEIHEFSLKQNVSIIKSKGNTFYDWVATFLPFNPTTIEFWLYLFPAVFYDIIAPLGLYIALGVKRKKRK